MLPTQRVFRAAFCCIAVLFSACSRFNYTVLEGVDKHPYLLFESGKQTQRYLSSITSGAFDNGDASAINYVVIASETPMLTFQATTMLKHAQPWDKMSDSSRDPNLWPVLQAMFPMAKRNTRPRYWILSTNPVVVAVDSEEEIAEGSIGSSFVNEGRMTLGWNFRFIAADALVERVKEIVIADCWQSLQAASPADWDPFEKSASMRRAEIISPTMRSIPLPAGTTLREAINEITSMHLAGPKQDPSRVN